MNTITKAVTIPDPLTEVSLRDIIRQQGANPYGTAGIIAANCMAEALRLCGIEVVPDVAGSTLR